LKGKRGRGTLESEKPPILGLLERGGRVVLKMLANVQQKTIKPLFEKFVKAGSMVNSDEYVIYDRLESWGYGHVSVNHSAGEFARDADGDGVNEVHVNTLEGFWSLLRSWLRVHRGISQERLPLYLGFFGVVHNVRLRGRGLLGSLLALLLVQGPCNP
jgi:transposase-like protein